jgi:hypothetical protein
VAGQLEASMAQMGDVLRLTGDVNKGVESLQNRKAMAVELRNTLTTVLELRHCCQTVVQVLDE